MSVSVFLPVFMSIFLSVFVGNIFRKNSRAMDRAPTPAHFPNQFHAPVRNTFCNLDKHTWQLGEIHLAFWTITGCFF